jgi:uncharacterized membrane protein
MLGAGYPLLDVFFSTLYFVLFIFWIILVFHIFQDVFRSHDLGGAGKALWVLFILVLPLVGCLVYLVARGRTIPERQLRAIATQQKAFEDYIRKVASTKE